MLFHDMKLAFQYTSCDIFRLVSYNIFPGHTFVPVRGRQIEYIQEEKKMDEYEESADVNPLYVNQRIHQVEEKRENIIAGIVGAFLGTLIGLVCIVVVDQLGYMASISGVVMGVCAIKGYQLLAGKMSLKGCVLSTVFMICVVYVSQQLSWAIDAAEILNIDVFSAFRLIPEMIRQGAIDGGVYIKDLLMLYAFTALGAVPTIWNTIKSVTNRSV